MRVNSCWTSARKRAPRPGRSSSYQLAACSRSASASCRTMTRRPFTNAGCPASCVVFPRPDPSCRRTQDWPRDPSAVGRGFRGAIPGSEPPRDLPRFGPTTTADSRSSRRSTSRRNQAVAAGQVLLCEARAIETIRVQYTAALCPCSPPRPPLVTKTRRPGERDAGIPSVR